jgi:hypothetical protein
MATGCVAKYRAASARESKCEEEDLNLHAFRHQILSQIPGIAAMRKTLKTAGFALATNAPRAMV